MIRFFINLYIYIIIADVIISFIPQYANEPWARFIRKLANYTLDPVRKILPKDLPFDISPLIVIILLQLIPTLW